MTCLKRKCPDQTALLWDSMPKYWLLIMEDLVAAFNNLFNLDGKGFDDLNAAFLFLLPKRQGASEPNDYRPISLVHSFAKLFSKVLARRLAAELPKLVSCTQGAFLQNRSTHDNFMLISGTAKVLRQIRCSSFMLKLDIA